MPLYRLLVCVLPLQLASLLGFTWYATRPPAPVHITRHAAATHTPAPSPDATQADRVLMVKSSHTLTLYHGDKVLGTFYAMTGRDPGPKQKAGDLRTPEGRYFVDKRKTDSCCFLALHLSYPGPADKARASADHVDAGQNIEIHGLPRHGPPSLDPTKPPVIGTHGCIELSNEDMEKVFKAVPLGTPVQDQSLALKREEGWPRSAEAHSSA